MKVGRVTGRSAEKLWRVGASVGQQQSRRITLQMDPWAGGSCRWRSRPRPQ